MYNIFYKGEFIRLFYTIRTELSKTDILQSGEAENLISFQCQKVNGSVVPV